MSREWVKIIDSSLEVKKSGNGQFPVAGSMASASRPVNLNRSLAADILVNVASSG